MGILEKIGLRKKEKVEKGVQKSRAGLLEKIGKAIAGKDTVDASVLDELEEILITSDVGVKTTVDIIDRIEKRVARDKYTGSGELQGILREEITALLKETGSERPAEFEAEFPAKPHIIMVVGVNGVGKITGGHPAYDAVDRLPERDLPVCDGARGAVGVGAFRAQCHGRHAPGYSMW